jgi:MFS family permease
MKHFSAATGNGGVAPTLLVLALVYFVFMMGGALGYRLPSPGWHPPATALSGSTAFATTQHVHLNSAWTTPQFWLVWGVLCMNVTAGIGVLSMASPMLQEVFGGRLIGTSQGFADLSAAQKTQIAAIAAGFTGLLSLFNIFGRFFWASISDWIGRKSTYYCFFLLGIALYALTPALAHRGEIALFVAAFCVILSMYGGGFSTVPAYLADLFGTQMVGAIHGRLLTAWSAAGVIGPVLIAQLREFELAHGVPNSLAYDTTFYTLTGFLVLGLICNLLVRRTPAHYMMTPEELAAEQAIARDVQIAAPELPAPRGSSGALLLAWLAVCVPIAWGVWMTLQKAVVLFR